MINKIDQTQKSKSANNARVWAKKSYWHRAIVLAILFSPWVQANSNTVLGTSAALGQVMLGLIFICVLILTFAFVAKRLGYGTSACAQHMKILSTMNMGAKEKLILIEAGPKTLLLGVTSQSVNTLHVYTDQEWNQHKIQVKKQQRSVQRYSMGFEHNKSKSILPGFFAKPKKQSEKADFSAYLKDIINPSSNHD